MPCRVSVYIHDDAYLAIVVLLNSTPYRGQRTEYTSMRVQNKLWMSRNEVVLHVCTFVEHGLAGLGWGEFISIHVLLSV